MAKIRIFYKVGGGGWSQIVNGGIEYAMQRAYEIKNAKKSGEIVRIIEVVESISPDGTRKLLREKEIWNSSKIDNI